MTTYTQEQLNQHRHINIGGSYWYEGIFGQFEQEMQDKGIAVSYRDNHPEIYFSGLWSQGDGACFAGHIDDMEKFLSENSVDNDAIKHLLAAGGAIYFKSYISGRYCHEHSVSFDYRYEHPEDLYDADDFRLPVLQALCPEDELSAFEDQAAEIFRGHMRSLYRQLEEEYTYQTSDEQVAEALEANGITPKQDESEVPQCLNY